MKAIHLRGKLRSLGKQLTGEILRMILDATPIQLAQLAAMTPPAATGATKKRTKRVAGKPATQSPLKQPPPSRAEQHRNRLPTETTEQLKNSIILVLCEANGPLSANAIALRMNSGVSGEQLALPIQSLRRSGHVSKSGERSPAVYALVDRQAEARSDSTGRVR